MIDLYTGMSEGMSEEEIKVNEALQLFGAMCFLFDQSTKDTFHRSEMADFKTAAMSAVNALLEAHRNSELYLMNTGGAA